MGFANVNLNDRLVQPGKTPAKFGEALGHDQLFIYQQAIGGMSFVVVHRNLLEMRKGLVTGQIGRDQHSVLANIIDT